MVTLPLCVISITKNAVTKTKNVFSNLVLN